MYMAVQELGEWEILNSKMMMPWAIERKGGVFEDPTGYKLADEGSSYDNI